MKRRTEPRIRLRLRDSRKLVVNVQDYVRRFAGLEDGEARERLQEFLDRLIKENPGAVAVDG